jgi:hypothetical protein
MQNQPGFPTMNRMTSSWRFPKTRQRALMEGTGGCRKLRFAGKGKGKRGGFRTVHYYGGDDVPVLLLALIDKGEDENLSKAERNELRIELAGYADDYRKGVIEKVAALNK